MEQTDPLLSSRKCLSGGTRRTRSIICCRLRERFLLESGIMAVHEHHQHAGARKHLRAAVITASDTRTAADDESGYVIRTALEGAGHTIVHYAVLPDDEAQIRETVIEHLSREDLVIINGGTGIAPRDSTIEAIRPVLNKELEGFGEL